jgi:16S rRNA (cytosine1402-N4)-methyltransferase
MRMDRTRGETAADLVNRLPERELGNLLYELGDERASRRIAAAICAERRRARIETTGRLAEIVRRAVRGRGRIDAATRTFQALRMAVNDELGELARGIEAATARLRPGGRIAVISFHSGEDRFVKHTFRSDERLEVLTKKVVRPSREEARANRRARSAKLRAAERRS